MTVLKVIEYHRITESVFKRYDKKADVCMGCHTLFETLEEVAENIRWTSFNFFRI